MDSEELEVRSLPAPATEGACRNVSGGALQRTARFFRGGASAIKSLLHGLGPGKRGAGVSPPGLNQDSLRDTSLRLDPACIKICSATEFSYSYYRGVVHPGDWDLSKKRFDRLDVFHAFKTVCKERARPWQETSFYKTTVAAIESGQELWGCRNKDDFDARCGALTRLFETIELDGYKSQRELVSQGDGEVSVAIGRNGEFLFSDGAHRLCIAKLLGLSEIPVVVTVRHPEWVQFKEQLAHYARSQPSGALSQPLTHPDLASIPADQESSGQVEAIVSRLGLTSGRVLDLGGNLGLFCHRLEELGLDCVAFEGDEQAARILSKLRDAEKKRFVVRQSSFLSDDDDIMRQEYDLVLAMKSLRPLLHEGAQLDSLTSFLGRLNARRVALEARAADQDPLASEGNASSSDELVALVMREVGLSRVECLLEGEKGGRLLLLS